MRHKRLDLPVRLKIIDVGISMYLDNGFAETTNKMIADQVGISTGSFSNCFRTKEDLLLELVKRIAPFQFESTENLTSPSVPPLLIYCLELAVELVFCEQEQNARQLYLASYSLPKTLDFIKQFSYKKSQKLLGQRLPEWTEQDFYEVEIMTTSIMFGCIMERCNARFTIEQKITRCLDNLMKLYDVDSGERKQTIEQVLSCDLNTIAANIMQQLKDNLKAEHMAEN